MKVKMMSISSIVNEIWNTSKDQTKQNDVLPKTMCFMIQCEEVEDRIENSTKSNYKDGPHVPRPILHVVPVNVEISKEGCVKLNPVKAKEEPKSELVIPSEELTYVIHLTCLGCSRERVNLRK